MSDAKIQIKNLYKIFGKRMPNPRLDEEQVSLAHAYVRCDIPVIWLETVVLHEFLQVFLYLRHIGDSSLLVLVRLEVRLLKGNECRPDAFWREALEVYGRERLPYDARLVCNFYFLVE